MQPGALQRLTCFRDLDTASLNRLAATSRLLRLPGGRVQRFRAFPFGTRVYLWHGDVERTAASGRVDWLSHRQPAAQEPVLGDVFPRLITRGRVQLLVVDPAARVSGEPLRTLDLAEPGDAQFDAWLSRFLGGPILKTLPPAALQRLFRGFSRLELRVGEPVLRQGEPASQFFVLRRGEVEIVRDGELLALVRAGGFFGEDGLLSGLPRSATARARTSVEVMALPAVLFAELVASTVLKAPPAGLDLLAVEVSPQSDARRLAESLDPGQPIVLRGGSPERRRLIAFLLTQRGFEVYAAS